MELVLANGVKINADIRVPSNCKAWIVFPYIDDEEAVPRRWLTDECYLAEFGIFQTHLLNVDECRISENKINLELLSERLISATNWLMESEFYNSEPVIFLGYGVEGAASLVAAFEGSSTWPLLSVVSVDGRPDLVRELYLTNIHVPVLLAVGEKNRELLALNQLAENYLEDVELLIIEKAEFIYKSTDALDQFFQSLLSWIYKLERRNFQIYENRGLNPDRGSHHP